MDTLIYKLSGEPLGFIRNGKLYNFLGKSLGWQTSDFLYNKSGQYCGKLFLIAGNHYIIKFILDLQPLPLSQQIIPDLPIQEINVAVPPNVNRVDLPAGYTDGFQ